MGVYNTVPCDYRVEVTNRFKGLDLTDRVPEGLLTGTIANSYLLLRQEVCNAVQETVTKTIPKKKKSKKAK